VQDVPGAASSASTPGPSLVTMPQVFRDLFAATGGWPDDLDLEPLDPIARYRFADGSTLRRRSRPARRAGGAGRRQRRRLARLHRPGAAGVAGQPHARSSRARSTARAPSRGWRCGSPRDIAAIAPGRSLRSLGRQHLRDPRLRMFLDRYATYTGSDPRRAPAALAAVPYVEQAYGGWYVPAGCTGWARRSSSARSSAAPDPAVQQGVPDPHRRRAGQRRAAGHRRGAAADVVVANADAAHVYGDLVSAPARAGGCARATPSLSGFVLLLAVRGRTPGSPTTTCCSPATTTPSSTPSSATRPSPSGPDALRQRARRPAVRPDGCEAWFVW
jgi:phytoene dehydrogenase-like protein